MISRTVWKSAHHILLLLSSLEDPFWQDLRRGWLCAVAGDPKGFRMMARAIERHRLHKPQTPAEILAAVWQWQEHFGNYNDGVG